MAMAAQQSTSAWPQLTDGGTSVWLDQIRRSLIESGELQRADRRGLAARRDLQPGDLREGDPRVRRLRRASSRELAEEGKSGREIYERDRRQGRADGRRRAAPGLGGDRRRRRLRVARGRAATSRTTPTATLEQAREYWERVDRPNVMIKIPGTDRGPPRDRAGDLRGHQHQRHAAVLGRGATRKVAEAYIRGLERRHEEGKPLDVHSVASFFVSRVDTEVDKRLEELGDTELQGTRGAGERARRLPGASRRSSAATASRSCARPARRCSARSGRRPA